MPIKPMNDKRWEHPCSNGTVFTCERCDFAKPIIVDAPDDIEPPQFWQDLAEMIGCHALNIWPNLNGFQGYDTIRFEVADREEDREEDEGEGNE